MPVTAFWVSFRAGAQHPDALRDETFQNAPRTARATLLTNIVPCYPQSESDSVGVAINSKILLYHVAMHLYSFAILIFILG